MSISNIFRQKFMKKNITVRISLMTLSIAVILGSCVTPNDPIRIQTEILLTQVDQLNTIGYARDIFMSDSLMFVAASQAGGQIWTQRNGEWGMRYQREFSTAELELVRYDAINRLWMTADKRSGYVLAMDSTQLGPDPAFPLQQFSDSNTQDFVFDSAPDSLAVWLADLDGSDGFKYFNFKRGLDPFGLLTWEITTGEKIKVASYTGMDKSGDRLGIARSELGVEVFNLPVQAGSQPVIWADTPGEALDVNFYNDQLLVADNWAGLLVFQVTDTTLTELDQLAMNGWVKHIDLWGDYAFLSCAGNGLFVAKLSPTDGKVSIDQSIPISYVYDVTVAGNLLYVASREGIMIYQIEMNPNG
ncbi:MAG: hypothetical protein AUJ47_01970 [Candidatus Marinimicrobia bacterium CG1_02_48_14]|nr:MAG: hypothetical protein AUJ47_01970 [Candidatus Marinimicrobia bacterium CG1_02_48_14]PIZ61611.1 MAG: hypothetical protein COY19_12140 [Candidatus Marinimicrobia bacterium CG_4_10_14_0_2_um_filter_48_9]PJA51768.1 MAG: hypothetical protein CO167_12270 [Candidatus Marinimicrobia bacterium CG_4_9_14_3_um_filter_48_9]